jgi:hypothetical protein
MRHTFKSVPAGLLTVLLVSTAASVAVQAGHEPWQERPYDQWTAKDIQKIFTDSPWARTSTVEAVWARGALAPDATEAPGGTPFGTAAPQGSQGQNKPMGASGGYTPGAGSVTPQAEFLVYWMSSRTMRGAVARQAMLRGTQNAAEAAKYVAAAQADYQIVIQGADMIPFQKGDEKAFASLAWLRPKQSKQKIAPSKVELVKDARGKVNAAIFHFPKKDASGEPVIGAGTKSVEFECKVGDSAIQAKFEPPKMVDPKGQDL